MLRWLSLFLGLALATPAMALTRPVNGDRLARQLCEDFERGKLAERTDDSLRLIVKLAVWKLRAEGYDDAADAIEADFAHEFEGYLARMVALEDLGDHEPLSEWLALVTETLQLLLGDTVMKLLHLDDLRIINYAIPVVFDPTNDEWDKPEYKLHFVPLAGVTSFWVTWGVCVGATWGAGVVVLCGPAGMIAEWAMVRYFAPGLSDWVYDRANGYWFEASGQCR